jgi:MFS family permease
MGPRASQGWSRAGVSSASTLAFLSMGVGGFLWGWLFDRYGARGVVLLGGLLQGFGLVMVIHPRLSGHLV